MQIAANANEMDSNKLSALKNPPASDNNEEPYPSLSDFHDYEPNLEFDDSELHQSPDAIAQNIDFIQMEGNGLTTSSMPEENFDELDEPVDSLCYSSSSYPEVGDSYPTEDKFANIARYRIVDVKGDDSEGRKIIVVYAYRLPMGHEIDHELFLKYLTYTLDLYVEQDYSLVYFHYGLSSKNKPSLRWLVQAYKAFDRKYKKNLKALFLVHPTSFLKIVSQIFRPFISVKFGRKLNYVNTLKELNEHISLEKLDIPQEVIDHDKKFGSQLTKPFAANQANLPTQQFGVSLKSIKSYYKVVIPPVVKQCVEYLDKPDALETEALFRRSANVLKIKQLKEVANRGEIITFDDPHEAAVLLKTFLRELKEPLLTFDRYDDIKQFQSWEKDQLLREVSILVMEKLPEDNYKILKYIISFLSRVMERSDLNKMSGQNLAIVFGPNLVWSELEAMSLESISPINMFTQFLLQNYNAIFMI